MRHTMKVCACSLTLLCAAIAPAANINATWNGGSSTWNNTSNWDIGTVPNNNASDTYNVFIDGLKPGSSAVILDLNATINTLTLETGDAMQVQAGRTLTVNGGITNDGDLLLSSTGSLTRLYLGASLTLGGNGRLLLGDNPAFNSIRSLSTLTQATLTNDVNHTIRGRGNIGENYTGIVNKGLIDATSLIGIDPGTAGVVNQGIMQASNGGTLSLDSRDELNFTFKVYKNVGGVIQALNGSTVYLGGRIEGGTITRSGTGKVTVQGADCTLAGTISNTGAIELSSINSIHSISIADNAVLTGGGQIFLLDSTDLNGSARNRIGGSGNAWTHDVNHTIRGGGSLSGDILNKGLIDATGGNYGLRLSAGSSVNQGVMQASGGIGKLRLVSGTIDNTAGVIQALNSGEVQLMGGTILGGLLQASGNGKFSVPNSSIGTLQGTITNNALFQVVATGNETAKLQIGPNTILGGTGRIALGDNSLSSIGSTSSNTLTNNSGHTIQGGGNLGSNQIEIINKGIIDATGSSYGMRIDPNVGGFTNEGTLQTSGAGKLFLSSGGFTNSGLLQASGGTIELAATAALHNTGVLKSNPGTTITVAGTYTDTAAAQVVNHGTLRFTPFGTSTVNASFTDSATGLVFVDSFVTLETAPLLIHGKIGGLGTIATNVEIASGGGLSPGLTTGTLTTENLNFGTGAIYIWDVSASGSDRVQVNGNLDFGATATLTVNFAGGSLPAVGNYLLFEATGTIDALPNWTIQLPANWSSQGIEIVGSQVLLKHLIAVAEPTPLPTGGDFDGDGDIDGADFVVWQSNFPATSGHTLNTGDADGDGDVDGADFVVWQTNFPYTPPEPGTVTVPEPKAALLATIGLGGIAMRRRKTQKARKPY
jgi:hypothetical protein